MKLLQQNPAPALLTGHSPPEQPAQTRHRSLAPSATPHFQGLPDKAISQFTTDTLGVWAPKVPLTRSKTQFFEDAFLELVEDGAYYFTLPIVGPILAKGLAWSFNKNAQWRDHETAQKLTKTLELYTLKPDKAYTDAAIKTIQKNNTFKLAGVPLQTLEKGLEHLGAEGETLLRPILAAKVGALLGTFAIAAGLEYMIQHTKNVITAKGFKTKNFAAVAGLESGKAHTQAGQVDPVEKAKKRSKQVGAVVLGSLALAVVIPQAILKNGKAFALATKFLRWVDFSKGFDISKPVLAGLITTGVVSYIDAARDSLERKETATRLAVVVPYLMFGKELAGFAIAKLTETFNVTVKDKEQKPLKTFASFTTGENPLKQMKNAATLLDFNVVKTNEKLIQDLEEANTKKALDAYGPKMAAQIRGAVIAEHGRLNVYSYLLSALVCGLGINWITYRQTQNRYKHQQQKLQNAAQSMPAQPLGQSNAPFTAHPPAWPGPQAVGPSPWKQTQPRPVQAFAQPFQSDPQLVGLPHTAQP
jgi:hypothetical protein